MIKIAKYAGATLLVIALILSVAYQFRTDPIAMLAGKRLSGEEQPYPADWQVCNEHMTLAVESRPEDPHSVTTLCIVRNGTLYIPAVSGSRKKWPQYVLADSQVRIKIGDKVYPAKATRELDLSVDEIVSSGAAKYPYLADMEPEDLPKDVWFFRISQR